MAGRPLRRANLSRAARRAAGEALRLARRRNPGARVHVIPGDVPGVALVTVDGKEVWSSATPESGNVSVGYKPMWKSKVPLPSYGGKGKPVPHAWAKPQGTKWASDGDDVGDVFSPKPPKKAVFDAAKVSKALKKLPRGSVVMFDYEDDKRGYFTTGTQGGGALYKITLKNIGSRTTLATLGQEVEILTVLHKGDGQKLSFAQAKHVVEVARGKKFPSYTGGGYSTSMPPAKPYVPPKPAYSVGGVLIRADGMVLLRLVAGYFSGTGWTFAKGRVDPGEDDIFAMKREVVEELGWLVEPIAEIPGQFLGSTTSNKYWLVKGIAEDKQPPVEGEKPGPFPDRRYPGWETSKLKWFTQVDARERIDETQSPKARTRDLQVLDAAYALYNNLKTGA